MIEHKDTDLHPPWASGRRAAIGFVAVLAFLVGFAQTVPAFAAVRSNDSQSAGPRRTAFVVGNSNYQNVRKLLNPSRDARAIAEKLARIGFEVTSVIDGDQKRLTEALKDFSKASERSDIALFYFAGHGIQVNGENYFLPVSTKGSTVEAVLRQSLSLNEVRRQIRRASPELTIFILDSCRDNPFGQLAMKKRWKTFTPLVLDPGLAQVQSAAGMLIAYATQPGKLAYDGKGRHSPFTASLLRHLGQPGLEVRLMLGRVREDVVAETAGAQIPWVEEAVIGEFYFAGREDAGQKMISSARATDVTFWRSIWRSAEVRDYEAYLTAFPNGVFATLASNRLKMLQTSDRVAVIAALGTEQITDSQTWRRIQNSLYWLGYYGGDLSGAPDRGVINALHAFQADTYEKPTGKITSAQMRRLHDSAAASLVTLGERLSDRIVFDRARLRGIERGISEIAQPAYETLKRKVAGVENGPGILAEAGWQLDAMRRKRDIVKGLYDQASQDYVTVVAAAGAGYAEQIQLAQFSQVRAGGRKQVNVQYLTSRRKLFVKHALDYAREGKINEEQWLEELR